MANITTDNDFKKDVLDSNVPTLVDFWAEWCGPCKMLSPVIDQISEEFKGKLNVYKVNIDDNPEVPTKYGVRGIPNLILFKNGEILDSKVGALAKGDLYDWLESHLA